MKKIVFIVSVVALALAAPAPAQAATDKVLEYPNAGIALAVPEDFEYQLLTTQNDVVRAGRQRSGQDPIIVAVLAIPVEANVTANAYANITEARSKKSPKIKGLEVLKVTSIPLGGLTGTARLISFVSGDRPTTALRAYFIREFKKPKLRICYVLTVTGPTSRQKEALRVFGTITRSVKLIQIEPPSPVKIDAPGPIVTDQKRGFSLRVPHRWHIRRTPTGAALTMTDFIADGQSTPVGGLTVASVDNRTDATAAGLKLMELLKNYFETRQNLTTKPLSQSLTKMAGFEAHQVILQQTPKTPSSGGPSAKANKPQVVVQRTICAVAGEPGEEGPQRNSYALTVFLTGRDTKAAVAVMEKLAAGLTIIAPTVKPTTAPAVKIRPAVTKPAATKPAVTKPAATKPAATKPAATKPAATKPAATKPATTKPATAPAATQPASAPVIKILP